jgi:hypothetical protein
MLDPRFLLFLEALLAAPEGVGRRQLLAVLEASERETLLRLLAKVSATRPRNRDA